VAARGYASDLNDAQWALIEWHIPPARPGGRPRRVDICAIVNAIFYLLRTGCQWRLLPKEFPPWGTVWWYVQRWRRERLWVHIYRALYPLARAKAVRRPGPSVVIMDGQSVKTTEGGRLRLRRAQGFRCVEV
jgi:putative transposase